MSPGQLPTDAASLRLMRIAVKLLGVSQLVFVFALPTLFGAAGPTVRCAVEAYGPQGVLWSSMTSAFVLLLAIPVPRLRTVGALLWAAADLAATFAAYGRPEANASFLVMFGLAYPALALFLAVAGVRSDA